MNKIITFHKIQFYQNLKSILISYLCMFAAFVTVLYFDVKLNIVVDIFHEKFTLLLVIVGLTLFLATSLQFNLHTLLRKIPLNNKEQFITVLSNGLIVHLPLSILIGYFILTSSKLSIPSVGSNINFLNLILSSTAVFFTIIFFVLLFFSYSQENIALETNKFNSKWYGFSKKCRIYLSFFLGIVVLFLTRKFALHLEWVGALFGLIILFATKTWLVDLKLNNFRHTKLMSFTHLHGPGLIGFIVICLMIRFAI